MSCNLIKAFQEYKPRELFSEFYETLIEALFGLSCAAGVKRGGGPEGARPEFSPPTPRSFPCNCGLPPLSAAHLHARQRKPPAAQVTRQSKPKGLRWVKMGLKFLFFGLLPLLLLSLSLSSLLSRSSSFSSSSWIELSY